MADHIKKYTFIPLQVNAYIHVIYNKYFFSFWGIKYLVVIGGIIGAFFIPEGQFAHTWMVFGMIGGFCFILIQLILIIDSAHTWAEKWVCKYEIYYLLYFKNYKKCIQIICTIYMRVIKTLAQ